MMLFSKRASDFSVDFDKTKPPISGAFPRMVVTKSGRVCFHWVIEANSIEELAELGQCAESRIVVDFNDDYWRMPELLIYDDYIE